MPRQTLSLELPEELYQRICETAATVARSVQDVVATTIALSLPPLEKDLPPKLRSELAAMALLSSEQLQEISSEVLAEDRQARLEILAERQKGQPSSATERSELDELMQQAQGVMLHRAEARRLLALRGHPTPSAPRERGRIFWRRHDESCETAPANSRRSRG